MLSFGILLRSTDVIVRNFFRSMDVIVRSFV
jgi:hypothetical protein